MLDISGNNVKLWVDTRDGKNGKFNTYSISISKKVEDKYISRSFKVIVGRDVWIPDNLKNGTVIESFEGFPTLDIYTDRDGNERKEFAVFMQKVKWRDYGDDIGFTQMDERIPF